jgi:hypothetical protein
MGPRSAAPTEEISGTIGWTPAFNIAANTSAAAGDAPERPRAIPFQANGKSSAQLSRGQGLSNTSAVRHDEKRLLAADLLVT